MECSWSYEVLECVEPCEEESEMLVWKQNVEHELAERDMSREVESWQVNYSPAQVWEC